MLAWLPLCEQLLLLHLQQLRLQQQRQEGWACCEAACCRPVALLRGKQQPTQLQRELVAQALQLVAQASMALAPAVQLVQLLRLAHSMQL